MMLEEYKGARQMGQKEYRQCVARGEYPYLQALDEMLRHAETQGEESLGLVNIPVEKLAGTRTEGRRDAFARNFMPLLEPDSEFAVKWMSLCRAHLEEGIRDPIVAYEFMNRFYVAEGNKRCSVLKYFGAVSIPGVVRRILPKRQDTVESQVYFEFLDFYKRTGINYLWFSRPGRFKGLLLAVRGDESPWTEEERSAFAAAYSRFRRVFHSLGGGRKLSGTTGDALLGWLRVYGFQALQTCSDEALRERVQESWAELAAMSEEQPVELALDPEPTPGQRSILEKLRGRPGPLRAAFLHAGNARVSAWTQAHEEGRLAMAEALGDRVETVVYQDVTPENAGELVRQAAEAGCEAVFTTSPVLMEATMKASVAHPEVKFFNCSVYTPHPTIRTYYGRMYEVKLLAGLAAGAMTRSHQIGYIADYPIYGTMAAINAFALGARMADPEAVVHLEWRSRGERDLWERLVGRGVDMLSGQDLRSPIDPWRAYGLYRVENGVGKGLAAATWNWGRFYRRILEGLLEGERKRASDKEPPRAINYWWGLSAGVVDFHYEAGIPPETMRLLSLTRDAIMSGRFLPFSGRLTAQGGRVIREEGTLTAEEILTMDWLGENVIGDIPRSEELIEEARALVAIQGVRPEDRGVTG